MNNDSSKEDARDKRIVDTERDIEAAFLKLKSEKKFDRISISDVCRSANISRSTFYERYGTMENLLFKTIDHILEKFPPVEKSVGSYRWSKQKGGPPMCMYVRSHKEVQGLFYDPEMHRTIVERRMSMDKETCWDIMSQYGDIPQEQYVDLLRYQMFGCLSMMSLNASQTDEEWSKTKDAIDNMIFINLNNHTV